MDLFEKIALRVSAVVAAFLFALLTACANSPRLATPPEQAAITTPPPVTARPPTGPRPALPAPGSPSGTFIMSAERAGRWELYAARPDGAWSQLTRDDTPARAPALSPDGKQVAFQSRRDGNWEIYRLQLASGQMTRLTNQPAYDGAPSWSPDGARIAYESYRAGDLDIWVMNADGSNPVNLTLDEPNYDYGPAWSPRGDWVAFTSWATGHKQIFLTSPDGKKQFNLSQGPFDDEQPAWSPDGQRLAFVSNREGCEEVTDPIKLNACQRREVYVADFDGAHLNSIRQLTFDGQATAPAWSPDGQFIAYVSPRPGRQPLLIIPASGGIAQGLDLTLQVDSAAWGNTGVVAAAPAVTYPPLYVEKPIAAPAAAGHPYAMQVLPEIYLAPSYGQISSRVAVSLLALRAQIDKETGHDFLGVLSDMTRDIKSKCDVHCDNLSWHKSGRAVDVRLDYADSSGRSLMEVVREDKLGETYWRLYVRTTAQDGTMGEPLKDAPWDFSYQSRAVIGPQQGGVQQKLPPRGYYVDFTGMARVYGWERISSHDDPDFDWHTNLLGTEYWHYQKTDCLDWYQAMTEVYGPSDLGYNFEWNRIQSNWGVDQMRVFFKEIPPPPTAWKWYALVPR
ncbi:MAG: hypothetical protein WCF84_18115 [Anaerolineae bacterium]